ncbi:MAG: alanine--tRNA ligase [archaeon]
MISSKELREKYLEYFKDHSHAIIQSASLIPENDPTVLFTTAGMHPLVPYLLGEKHPLGKRLVNVQKCIRTGDIEDVGDSWHLSFFEMLGNWSLGDYFKKEAIEMSFEFLTSQKYLAIPKERLSVTCFVGDNDCPRDLEAASTWENLGMPKNRIHFLPKADNWWGPAGLTGPCGPDTEMFFHVKDMQEKSTEEFIKLNKNGTFCEIWNDVLMQYNKNTEGKYLESNQKNIDTGMGVERTVAVLNGFDNAYECDTLKPIMQKVAELAEKKSSKDFYSTQLKSARVITDHLRSATMILGDNKALSPSNVDQGYILRRFIRRAIRHARLLDINGKFCKSVAQIAVKVMGEVYPEVEKNKKFIFDELEKEEEKFSEALEKGTKVLEKKLEFLAKSPQKQLNAKGAFDLFQSFGFPLEMTVEMCKEKGFEVDSKGFEELLKQHQDLSRKGAEQKFKGGLADASEATTRLHTATHLLNQALREVLGSKDIHQKGSNINAERLRFDFNSDRKLTDEELKKIEDWVNVAISSGAEVKMEILSPEEAKKQGAQGVFDSKYGDKVKVYTVQKGNKIFSKEICGGPHVENTKTMGKFKILKEEAVAAGVRRIKAILE